MKRAALLLLLVFALAAPSRAAAQEQTRWRFAFGEAGAVAGAVRVAPDMRFAPERGYGFEPGAQVRSVRNSRLRGPHVAADGPFRFSVAVPEGDYRVTVRASGAHVLAETRRLMLERTDSLTERTFVVNVRNAQLAPPPANAPGGDAVRLSARESASLNWDDKLTLEFAGAHPRLGELIIERVDVARIFLLGDSTVADQAEASYASWGQMLTRFVGDGASVANHAQSGESLRTFLANLRLEKALAEMRPGDWALIQFGHNDQKSQWPQSYAPAETTYRAYLRVYIEEIRRRGGHAVLVTPPQRRTFNASGRIENSHGAYADAVRAVAAEMNAPLIDLSQVSTTFYETLGPERSLEAFAPRDGTHHNAYGAYELARGVVQAIRRQGQPIARFLRMDTPTFFPEHPDPIGTPFAR